MEVGVVTWYRWRENVLQILRNNREVEIKFSDITIPQLVEISVPVCTPIVSKDERYIAVRSGKKIYVHDGQNNEIIESPGKFKDYVHYVRFDDFNHIFYIEGNRIGVWDIHTQKAETLYNMNRAVHGPEWLGVSPDGRYVSFCKYRSNGYYLFIYDRANTQKKSKLFYCRLRSKKVKVA